MMLLGLPSPKARKQPKITAISPEGVCVIGQPVPHNTIHLPIPTVSRLNPSPLRYGLSHLQGLIVAALYRLNLYPTKRCRSIGGNASSPASYGCPQA
jgi:hypothetical protein